MHDSFYGGEATLLQSNVFKIYVAGGGLHLARVADRFYREVLESGQPSLAAGLGGAAMKHGVVMPAVQKQKTMEAQSDALEPGSTEFLALDKRNFSATGEQIVSARLSQITALTQGPGRVGFLELQLSGGKKRRFTLTGSATPEHIEKLIRQGVPNAEGSLL